MRVVIVGAGALGTMHAWHAVARGHQVVHLEREPEARGASVRNFGLVWVGGRAAGAELRTALRARELWQEIGDRVPNLPNPPSYYIVGRPIQVIDDGGGCTSVKCELFKGDDNNPATAKAEEIWQSLNTDPPVPWRASIYGYPDPNGGLIEARKAMPGTDLRGSKRYLVSKMDWRSLALTRRPANDSLTGTARIITEKALIKSMSVPIETGSPIGDILANMMLPPRSREELKGAHWGEHIARGRCPHAGGSLGNSVASFREHFSNCSGCDPWQSDIFALALMQLLKRGAA